MKVQGRQDERKSSPRCAVYTRVSTEYGLEQEFNSLDNQREAAEAYVKSQAHEGWKLLRERYDDGGFSGGSMERPGLRGHLKHEPQSREKASISSRERCSCANGTASWSA
jgi:Resolvase, N terminal domain